MGASHHIFACDGWWRGFIQFFCPAPAFPYYPENQYSNKGKEHQSTQWAPLKNSDFVTILRYSQKMFPYISVICCVYIFCSHLVLFRIFRGAPMRLSPLRLSLSLYKIGRGERIRTSDSCVPNAVLYQAELHPENDWRVPL